MDEGSQRAREKKKRNCQGTRVSESYSTQQLLGWGAVQLQRREERNGETRYWPTMACPEERIIRALVRFGVYYRKWERNDTDGGDSSRERQREREREGRRDGARRGKRQRRRRGKGQARLRLRAVLGGGKECSRFDVYCSTG